MNIATGDLAALPASREELEALNQVLHERLRDAETELHRLRAWADAMPFSPSLRTIMSQNETLALSGWMAKRPEPDTPKPATNV